jgi:hypothetical protein
LKAKVTISFDYRHEGSSDERLDIAAYGVDPSHIYCDIWFPVATAIMQALDNVHYKASDPEWLEETSR